MAEAYISEIRIFPFNFAPTGWAMCNGQLMAISQNEALFALIGTFYGGDGISTFALPNLQGRAMVSQGQAPGLSNYSVGELAGQATHVLTLNELPSHTHPVNCVSGAGNMPAPQGNVWAGDGTHQTMAYATPPPALSAMADVAIGSTGGGQAHENTPPYLVFSVCICLFGVFPSRN